MGVSHITELNRREKAKVSVDQMRKKIEVSKTLNLEHESRKSMNVERACLELDMGSYLRSVIYR